MPLENAQRTLRVRELCARLEGASNPAAGSDLAAAALLADAAARGCLLNVDVNAVLLPDSPAAAHLRRGAEAVATKLGRATAPAQETT